MEHHVGVQIEVVRHDHRPQHPDGDGDGGGVEAGYERIPGGGSPIGLHQGQLHQIAGRDDADDDDDHPLDMAIATGHDQSDLEHHGDRPTDHQRQPEEQAKAEGSSQQFGHVGGDAGQHDAAPEKTGPRPREPLPYVVGQAVTGHDAQPGRHALEQDEHQRGQGYHPEQRIAELASPGDVGGPVAGIDEPHRDDEARPQVAEKVAADEDAQLGQPGWTRRWRRTRRSSGRDQSRLHFLPRASPAPRTHASQSTGRSKKSLGLSQQTWSMVALSRPNSLMASITRGTMK